MKQLKFIRQILGGYQPLLWIVSGLGFTLCYLCSGGVNNSILWVGAFYFFVGHNILFYSADDVFDNRATLKPNNHYRVYSKWLIILSTVPAITFLIISINTAGRVALTAALLCASAGKLSRLFKKPIPLLDMLVSVASVFLAAVCGFLFADANLPWIILLAISLWGLGNYCISSVANSSTDRDMGKPTLTVLWGVRRSSRLSFISYLVAGGLIFLTSFPLGVFPSILILTYGINVSFFLKYKSDAFFRKFIRCVQNYTWLNYVVTLWLIFYLLVLFNPILFGLHTLSYISYVFIVITTIQFVILLHNFISFRLPRTGRLSEWPKISILIHAYNQADNIASTLLAALGQNYPNYEIIFTDLGSTDNTKSIAEGYDDKKLKIVSIEPPKPGWSVNSWASNELLKQANGQISLILGADTVMLPNTLSNIASLMSAGKGKDLISFLPADQNKTLSQKLILSHNQAFLLSVFPVAYLSKNFPQFSSAYGGMMAFSTEKIRLIDGLSLVKSSPLEDLDLASHAKLHGLKTAFYLASGLALSQNHADLGHIISQNIRRFYPTLRFNYPLTIMVFFSGLFAFTGPLTVLILTLINRQLEVLPIILFAIASGYFVRLIVALRGKQNVLAILFYPLSNILVMTTLAYSVVQYELLKPRWQKRTELSA